jgi:hypothetical protein
MRNVMVYVACAGEDTCMHIYLFVISIDHNFYFRSVSASSSYPLSSPFFTSLKIVNYKGQELQMAMALVSLQREEGGRYIERSELLRQYTRCSKTPCCHGV